MRGCGSQVTAAGDAHHAAQQPGETSGTKLKISSTDEARGNSTASSCNDLPKEAAPCDLAGSCRNGPGRIRTPAEKPGKTGYFAVGGAESGAPGALSTIADPELAHLVKAWPNLPPAIRAGIVAMVNAASR
jgi:hypothetical protein